MGFSYGIMLQEWSLDEKKEQVLYNRMATNPNLRLPVQLIELASRWQGELSRGPRHLLTPSNMYQKLALLTDYIESQAMPGEVARIMQAIETFGHGVGQWLKVAADSKARLLEDVLQKAQLPWQTSAELGTFVGYTAIRLGQWAHGQGAGLAQNVSLEVDPIHVLLTRHHLSLAHLSAYVDVWVGQASDLIPKISEHFGAPSLSVAFMDHRGTKFHSDLQRLEQHGLRLPGFTLVCDNVLKPGAPLLCWHAAHLPPSFAVTNWSLDEFAHYNSEDWMLVSQAIAGPCA